jgi:large subunit ribosomal protein L35
MPKIKTHKGAATRFHVTGSGKLMQTKIGKSHLRIRKPKRIKGKFDETFEMNAANNVRIKRLLPYAK